MTSYGRALELVLEAARRRGPLGAEEVPARLAPGRVAARALRSPEDLPAFHNSSMDGYALSSRSTRRARPGSPLRLRVSGTSLAGDAPRRAGPGACLEIATGAPLPAGLDAVVRLEDARVLDRGRAIELTSPAEPGDWVRRRGQDLRAGTALVSPGELLGPRHLLAFSALGLRRVAVRRRPLAAVVSTGAELAAAGARPRPGEIRNATESFLEAFLAEAGARPWLLGRVPDEPRAFLKTLRRALDGGADLVVTTGAVSAGRRDFVAEALADLGARVLYHGLALRPGKPGLFARLPGGAHLFGLPGNPVSTVVGARFLVLPHLRALLGRPPERLLPASLARPVEKPEGFRCFYKARLRPGPRGLEAEVLEGQASFQLKSLLEADAWAVLPEEGGRLRAGAPVLAAALGPSGALP